MSAQWHFPQGSLLTIETTMCNVIKEDLAGKTKNYAQDRVNQYNITTAYVTIPSAMNFQIHNPDNCYNSRDTLNIRPAITVEGRGLFELNRALCEMMRIKARDMVALIQDTDTPKDWYITKVDAKGFELKPATRDSQKGTHFFNSASLTKKVLGSLNEKRLRARVGDEPITTDLNGRPAELFPIITLAGK